VYKEKEDVRFKINNNIGFIQLNRPQAINSLNTSMVRKIYKKLIEWKRKEEIKAICISGEGAKGFCAGGDMKRFYEMSKDILKEEAYQFFLIEYKMDLLIHSYPKPVIVYMDGITMGGGVGISSGASHKIVTHRTKWGMPEMNIGFFPDVGSSYIFNKMPGFIGHYLALTSNIISFEDIIYLKEADYLLENSKWENLKENLTNINWENNTKVDQKVTQVLSELASKPVKASNISLIENNINTHFKFDTVERIFSSLEASSNKGDEWAENTLNTLKLYSPVSLKVTLEQLKQGERKTINECFDMELALSMSFMSESNFFEGVRAVLIDKDKSPKWVPTLLDDVPNDYVSSFFNFDKYSVDSISENSFN